MSAGTRIELPSISRVFHDYLTGEDGETFAIGRGLAMMLFVAILFLPLGVAVYAALTAKPSLPDWGVYLVSVGGFYATGAGAIMALVSGTKFTEPKATTTTETTVTNDPLTVTTTETK